MKKIENQDYTQVLQQIAHGDKIAFSKLYDLFWSDMLNHLLTKVNDIQVAEDIIHDIFISLWKKKELIIEIESVPAYLFSAARYKVFTYYRKKQLENNENLADLNHDIVDSSQPIEDRLYYRYMLDIVDKEIENLPEKCKEVFKLSRFSYLSNKEIALRLAISESTVENHINKAIRKLRYASGNKFMFFIFF